MHLYLVHHGDAVGPDVDAQRPLSQRGRESVEAVAKRASARQVKPAAIWHSGKLRARQTAEAYWRACNPLAEFTAVRGLQPSDPPEMICNRLSGEEPDLMLVGHFPNLPQLLNALVGGNISLDFPVHGLVALESVEGGWREIWRLDSP